MTVAQYKELTKDVKDFNKEIAFLFTAENTKIMTSVYPKIEIDETNELVKAYVLHKNSTEEKPIYVLSFACDLNTIFAIQFKINDRIETVDKDGKIVEIPTLQEQLTSSYLMGNYN